jgi:hypothetical protein
MLTLRIVRNEAGAKPLVDIVNMRQAIAKGYLDYRQVGKAKACKCVDLVDVSLQRVIAVNKKFIVEVL